jgi:dTDP-glucose 4,6-dehydratase
MKLLVTGGAGFIGSNFIRHILKKYKNYSIVNLDKLTYAGNLDNLKDIENNKHYKFIKGDICDPDIVNKLVPEVDAVINFAAETHVDRSIHEPGSFVKTDVFGTHNLLEAVKTHKTRKYIQISTDEVYGSIVSGSFTENSTIKPNSPYSASKASGDLLVLSYFKTYKLPVIITRSSNNYGPYQYPEKVIPLFVTNAIEGKSLPLYGDGKNVRDWLYVLDNCKAIDRVLHKGKIGEVYNIGGGNEVSNIELTKNILKMLNKPENMIKRVSDRPGHDRRYSLDCKKIKKQLGWKPEADFVQALKETVNWYVLNEKWWKKIKNKSYDKYYNKQYQCKG